jgi:hypothetical protein
MSIEGLLIAIVLTGISIAWVALPLLRGVSERSRVNDTLHKRRERLLIYYERVITNIRDLDEDSATGKITDDEYNAEREDWVQRGIQVLKALDTLDESEPTAMSTVDDAHADREMDAAIEAAIAARRERGSQQST